MSRFQFVADNSATFEVKRLCALVEIERSSYYAWLNAAPARAERARADAELATRIRAVHAEDDTQGAPRITAELNDNAPAGERVNHKRVARVMRLEGIRGYAKKRRVRTTIPEPSGQKYLDLLKRDFTAERPNRRYVGDITYLPLADGTNLYLATVIDCYSRRLAGWAIADHMRTSLVADALTEAIERVLSSHPDNEHEQDNRYALSFLEIAREIAGGHHEKWDGSGYPNGLAGNAIPLSARLMALADVFDALVCKRHYKEAFPIAACIDIIHQGRGQHFDPAIVDVFLANIDAFAAIADSHADPVLK